MKINKILCAAAAAAALLAATSVSAFCAQRPLFEIKAPMTVGAPVTVTTSAGATCVVGSVVKLPTTTRWPSYTASAWSTPGTVCASAVNAMHMLLAVKQDKGRTMSIIPQETIAPAAGAGASLVISTKAGEGVFGAWAPPVGSKVFVERGGTVKEISSYNTQAGAHYLPRSGDVLIIKADEFDDLPYMVDIENRPGGRVIGWYKRGYELLGRVIRPLGGTGRFEGTLFQRTGAIRANHSGVIDVSTSPRGVVGGFQIIPWDHAISSKEMQNVWNMTQWLVIGPADGKSKLGGSIPLFKEGLVPGPAAGEKLWDMWSTYGRKSLVLARYNGGKWQRLKEADGKSDTALKEITDLRIYYPFTEEIQKAD
ncbi:MAG: hypothetical protein RR340_00790 [Cloacibacillus sp.]